MGLEIPKMTIFVKKRDFGRLISKITENGVLIRKNNVILRKRTGLRAVKPKVLQFLENEIETTFYYAYVGVQVRVIGHEILKIEACRHGNIGLPKM